MFHVLLTIYIYINKRKFLRVCVFAPLRATCATQSTEFFFCRCISQGPQAPGQEFSISLLDFFFFKFKTSIFCDFFNLNFFFYTLNALYELDFLTVCGASISTWNKKRILKIDAIDFLKLIFESRATYILQYYWTLWQQ